MLTGSIRNIGVAAVDNDFDSDVTAYIPANATLPSSFNIATTDEDFKFPQTWRSNLAVDQKLPFGFVGTLELIYSKTVNNVAYINANQKISTQNLAGPDNRALFFGGNDNQINANITDAIVLKNTGEGRTINVTAKIERPMSKGLYGMVAYSFGQSKDIQSAGSVAFSSWRDAQSVNGNNNLDLGFSDNDLRHRVIGSLSYRKEFTKNKTTQISIFYEARNQGRFSYTYNGDLNLDGLNGNELLYIPTAAEINELTFAPISASGNAPAYDQATQRLAYESFIQGDDYLSENRGSYMERNGAILPWVFTMDVTLIEEFHFDVKGKRNTIQLRLDMFNFGNLLNSDWGVSDRVVNSSPIRVSSVDQATGQAVYQLVKDGDLLPYRRTTKNANLGDVYQLQFGVRYIFN